MLADHHGNVSKADAETVAECVAFVVMDWLDVDTIAVLDAVCRGMGAGDRDVQAQPGRSPAHRLHDHRSPRDAMTDDQELEPAA